MIRFQIIEKVSDGHTKFYYFDWDQADSFEAMQKKLADHVTNERIDEDNFKGRFFRRVKWTRTMQVKEYVPAVMDRSGEKPKMVKPGYVKRGGLKFKLHNAWTEVRFRDGNVARTNGYVPA